MWSKLSWICVGFVGGLPKKRELWRNKNKNSQAKEMVDFVMKL